MTGISRTIKGSLILVTMGLVVWVQAAIIGQHLGLMSFSKSEVWVAMKKMSAEDKKFLKWQYQTFPGRGLVLNLKKNGRFSLTPVDAPSEGFFGAWKIVGRKLTLKSDKTKQWPKMPVAELEVLPDGKTLSGTQGSAMLYFDRPWGGKTR
jgi:hypothetical protein